MSILDRYLVIAGLAGVMAGAPVLVAQDRDRDVRDQGSVEEAIRFEKAKQEAADRQQRIEDGAAREHRQKAPTVKRTEAETHRRGVAERKATEKEPAR
jgi:hypothetical protein